MAEEVGEPPTIVVDETFSQPSTSTAHEESMMKEAEADAEQESASDASIDWDEYESRKKVLIKKVVLCEQAMARIKVTAKFTRLKDLERRKEELEAGTDPEYVARVNALQIQTDKDLEEIEARYACGMAAIERANEGEMEFLERAYHDQAQFTMDQLLYANKLKQDRELWRIWQEDKVRADARIFVGRDVPDTWLDKFVKEYVDELDEREHGPDAQRMKRRTKFRAEAGETYNLGQSLVGLISRTDKERRWADRSMQEYPQWVYEAREKRKAEKKKKKERNEEIEKAVKDLKYRRVARMFGNERLFPRVPAPERRDEEEGEEWSEEGESQEGEFDVWDEDAEMDEDLRAATEMRRRVRKQRKREEEEKRELARLERFRLLEGEESGESDSEAERERDLPELIRRGVRAVILSHAKSTKPRSNTRNLRHERRAERLRNDLKEALIQKEEWGKELALQHRRQGLLQAIQKAVGDNADEEVAERGLDEICRDDALVRNLLRRSNGLPLLDEDGEMREAVRRNRKDKEDLLDRMAAARREGVKPVKAGRKRMKWGAGMENDEDSDGWKEEDREKRRKAMKKVEEEEMRRKREKRKAESEESEWEEEEENEERKGKKNKKKRGKRKRRKEEREEEEEEEEEGVGARLRRRRGRGENGREKEDEGEEVMEDENEKRKRNKKKRKEGEEKWERKETRGMMVREEPVAEPMITIAEFKQREREKIAIMRKEEMEREKRRKAKRREEEEERKKREEEGYGSDEDYGNKKKKKKAQIGFRTLPDGRKVPYVKMPSPTKNWSTMMMQLSEQRLVQDLFRSGALREQETAEEYAQRVQLERRQCQLAHLPATASIGVNVRKPRKGPKVWGGEWEEYGIGVYQPPEEVLQQMQQHYRSMLLSPRSQEALKKFPADSLSRLKKKERKKWLKGIDKSPGSDKTIPYVTGGQEEEEEEGDDESDVIVVDEEERKDGEEGVKMEEDDSSAGADGGREKGGENEKRKEVTEETPEHPREEEKKEEEEGSSPMKRVNDSPIRMERDAAVAAPGSKRKKAKQTAPKMNGFPARTGTATIS